MSTTAQGHAPEWFLSTLWRGAGWAYFTWPVPKAGKPRSEWPWHWFHFRPGERPPFPTDRDLYWSTNLLRERPDRGRGGESLVSSVGAIYADFDDSTDVDAILNYCPVLPTALIASGGGVHAYWLLNEPEEDTALARTLQKAWPTVVGSDPEATGIARPLRVPGSWNAKQTPLRPVYWLEGREQRTWSLRELAEAARPVLEDWAAAQEHSRMNTRELRPVTTASLAGALRFAANAKPGNRNKRLFWAACKLREGGCPMPDAERLALLVAEQNGLPDGEARRTVQSAYGASGCRPSTSGARSHGGGMAWH